MKIKIQRSFFIFYKKFTIDIKNEEKLELKGKMDKKEKNICFFV